MGKKHTHSNNQNINLFYIYSFIYKGKTLRKKLDLYEVRGF